ncbi:unnamed protein product [Arctia plantaginis]|uniref:Carboxylic ester hydrolase n=1 Tax=Arctia plantaginis TaxID=874455 RepID=A0A8S1AIS5_ARCPL|nr:unnamed protein product [Arctia plantaginis]
MSRWMYFLFLCVAVGATEHGNDEWLEVNIEQGPVRGQLDSGGELWTFLNIPYATAPTGKHKFKAPLPPPTWTKTYDAVDRRIICPQFVWKSVMTGDYSMQEDCLVANIYVPDTRRKNLSVLVYVHGGAFQLGYGDWFEAKNLLKYKDFIAVTFNYRLGIHGFLCLGTEDIPGNAGMKDQVALLKWVQKNIAAFGGNPNDVTIGGSSAGSMSVDLLTISKSAEGLFHKVIPESGSNLSTFSSQSNPLQNAKDHAKTLNFTNVDDIYQLEEFYKTLSYETLIGKGLNFDDPYFFTPCVERPTGDGSFLTESPFSILKSEEYRNMKKSIREIWHNFIKTGKPVPEGSSIPSWPPVGEDTSPYMSLGRTVELHSSALTEDRTRFWENIYQKYYQEPLSPPKPYSRSDL